VSRDATGREIPMEVYAGIGGDKIQYVFVGQLGSNAQKSIAKASTIIKRSDVYCHSLRSGTQRVKGAHNFEGVRNLPLLLLLPLRKM